MGSTNHKDDDASKIAKLEAQIKEKIAEILESPTIPESVKRILRKDSVTQKASAK